MNKKLKFILIVTIFVILNLLFSITVKTFAVKLEVGNQTFYSGTSNNRISPSLLTSSNNFYCTEPGVSNIDGGGDYTISQHATIATGTMAQALSGYQSKTITDGSFNKSDFYDTSVNSTQYAVWAALGYDVNKIAAEHNGNSRSNSVGNSFRQQNNGRTFSNPSILRSTPVGNLFRQQYTGGTYNYPDPDSRKNMVL